MTFDEITREAAKLADKAATRTMRDMVDRHVVDEDDVTAALVGRLHTEFERSDFPGIEVRATVLRHRSGRAAEERRIGADLLLHVKMVTGTQKYSKGVLIQAKKLESADYWSAKWRNSLVQQCEAMLNISAASFVFSYSDRGIRCGAATRVSGALQASPASLRYLCGWTSYRFFLELFRCPVGDPKITSARVDELPVPFGLELTFSGSLDLDPGASS